LPFVAGDVSEACHSLRCATRA